MAQASEWQMWQKRLSDDLVVNWSGASGYTEKLMMCREYRYFTERKRGEEGAAR